MEAFPTGSNFFALAFSKNSLALILSCEEIFCKFWPCKDLASNSCLFTTHEGLWDVGGPLASGAIWEADSWAGVDVVLTFVLF